MREFLLQCFKDLHPLTGLKQYLEIAANPDITQDYAQTLLNELIEPMLEASADFPYIPLPDQQKIIRRGIVTTDRKIFYHFDAYMIRKWLQEKAHLYFKEEAHKPTESNARPVTYDELNPDTRKAVDDLLKALASDNAGLKRVPEVTQKEIDDLKLEDLEEREGRKATPHEIEEQGRREELLILHNKKIEYGRLYSDPNRHDGKLLDGAPSFSEWILMDKSV